MKWWRVLSAALLLTLLLGCRAAREQEEGLPQSDPGRFVTVPELGEMDVDRARETLAICELTLGTVSYQKSGGDPGLVLGQLPLAGDLVVDGTVVNLLVSTERDLAPGTRQEGPAPPQEPSLPEGSHTPTLPDAQEGTRPEPPQPTGPSPAQVP